MFEVVKNRLYVYSDDSTLLAVVHKSAAIPSVSASLNRDLARIQEWCNHWCMIPNPSKAQALLVCRSKTVNPPHGDLVRLGFKFALVPTSNRVLQQAHIRSPCARY